MADGLATSYLGREGSGEAQILPQSSFDPVAYAQNLTQKLNDERNANRDKQIQAAEAFQDNLELDYDGWSDLLPELDKKYDALMAYAMDSYKQGVDVTNPENRNAHSYWNSATKEITNMGEEGIKLRDAYLKTQTEIAKNPKKYDLDHYNRWHEKVKATTTLEERQKAMREPALVPVFNPYDALAKMEAIGRTTKMDDTKYVRADKGAIEGEVDRFMATPEGEEVLMQGVRTGVWKTTQEMKDWYVGELVDSVAKSTIKDKPKTPGAGLEFNFGNGTARNKDWWFNYNSESGPVVSSGRIEDEDAQFSGNTEKVAIHTPQGKNVPPIQLFDENGEVRELIPVEFRRVNGGDIYMTATNEDGDTQYNVPFSTSQSNRLAIENAYNKFDVEGFMDSNAEKMTPPDDVVDRQSADYLANIQKTPEGVTRQVEMFEEIDWIDNAKVEDGKVTLEFGDKYIELDQSKQSDQDKIRAIYSGKVTPEDFTSEPEKKETDNNEGEIRWTPSK